MDRKPTKDQRHHEWRMFLLTHVVSFQEKVAKIREQFMIDDKGKLSDHSVEIFDPLTNHLITLEMMHSIIQDKDKTPNDFLVEHLGQFVVESESGPLLRGNSSNKTIYGQWESTMYELLDEYQLPVGYKACLESYIFDGVLDPLLLEDFEMRTERTEMGRVLATLTIDRMPSKKQWNALYDKFSVRFGDANQDFGAKLKILTPKDIELDKRIVGETAKKVAANKNPDGMLIDDDLVYDIFGEEQRSKMKPFLDLIQKRRQLAREDAERFFPSEALDF